MPADAQAKPDPRPTLGQRIDAMLGPLDTDAQAFREAITSGRAQMAQMQARIDQAEHALAGIEGKMIRVLQSLAAEEPMLALAMSAGDELNALPPELTSPPQLPTPAQPAPIAPPTDELPQAVEPAHQLPPPYTAPIEPAPIAEAESQDTPEVVTLEMQTPEDADESSLIPPTPAEDAAAVEEILGLLDTGLETPEASAEGIPGSSLAAAAAQADEVARMLDGVGE